MLEVKKENSSTISGGVGVEAGEYGGGMSGSASNKRISSEMSSRKHGSA